MHAGRHGAAGSMANAENGRTIRRRIYYVNDMITLSITYLSFIYSVYFIWGFLNFIYFCYRLLLLLVDVVELLFSYSALFITILEPRAVILFTTRYFVESCRN